jgi:hypothetical protein
VIKQNILTWRDKKPTKKQLDYIAYIQEFDAYQNVPAFKGATRGEACDFINKYRAQAYVSTWAIEHGYD